MGDDVWNWNVIIDGPEGTPFMGGKFVVALDFSENYPFKNPKVNFKTKIYHPNIKTDTGEICMLAIEKDWVPTRNAVFVIEAILTMLRSIDAENPQENDIAE